jgi:uncharacterized UBP type Zn finger protein
MQIGPIEYWLKAIIHHQGSSRETGHYYAEVWKPKL